MTTGARPSATRREHLARSLDAPRARDANPSTAATSAASTAKPRATVRLSIDLDRPLYRWLRVWAADEDVRHMDVVRALLQEVREDPALSERVLRRITEGKNQA